MLVSSPASSNLATTGCSCRLSLTPRQVACASSRRLSSPLRNATNSVVRRYLLHSPPSNAPEGSVCGSVIATLPPVARNDTRYARNDRIPDFDFVLGLWVGT